jgi:hypothetical protein
LTVTEKYGDFSGQNIMSFEAATMYILFSEIYQKRIKKKLKKECSFCPDPLTNMATTGNSCL